MAQHIALVRGINVGGRTRLPMATLREACIDAGLKDVRTYIQSGNVLFRAPAGSKVLEARIEAAIHDATGLETPVLVRSATQWRAYIDAAPFPGARKERPHLVHIALCKQPPAKSAATDLRRRATDGERVEVQGGVIWIDYALGSARSKLSSTHLDKAAGSPVTSRNWRTATKLLALLSDA